MKYSRVLEYMYSMLPMYQHTGPAAYKNNLDNITALCHALDNPQHKIATVHVAGTNGKGSSCHMLAAILQCAGYNVGLYTSPHLKNFTERIKINGKEIEKEFVIDFFIQIKPYIETIHPSFFEITTAMAFAYFEHQSVDLAIIEVGLGGRLDSTNVIYPVATLITNIGYDHTHFLGDTIEKIAWEKAGIIKSGVEVVVSQRTPTTDRVFTEKAKQMNAPITLMDSYDHNTDSIVNSFTERCGSDVLHLTPGLHAACQRKNVIGVLGTVNTLRRKGYKISADAITKGIANVVSLTGLKGRWQKIAETPLMHCDVAHNQDGIQAVMDMLQIMNYNMLHMVIGMTQDKDIDVLLSIMPSDAYYYFCKVNNPRMASPVLLKQKATERGYASVVCADVNEAIDKARKTAHDDDLIFIGGSTFVVADINLL